MVWRQYRRCDISIEKPCVTSLSQMWYNHRKNMWCDVTVADRKKETHNVISPLKKRKVVWRHSQTEETYNVLFPLKQPQNTWYDVTISEENRKGRNHHVWCHSHSVWTKKQKMLSVTVSKETMVYGVTATKENHHNSKIMSLLCKALWASEGAL